MTPLYGHTSRETAYVIQDYPYSFKLRTQMRVWLEFKLNKGYRKVSETLNPKTGRWNNPKLGVYVEHAAVLYLDDIGHVQWAGLTAFSDLEKFQAFITNFPDYPKKDVLKALCLANYKAKVKLSTGEIQYRINGKVDILSPEEIQRHQNEAQGWKELADKL